MRRGHCKVFRVAMKFSGLMRIQDPAGNKRSNVASVGSSMRHACWPPGTVSTCCVVTEVYALLSLARHSLQ